MSTSGVYRDDFTDVLSIDLETYSDVDIGSAGLYKYAENSEILLFAYAWNDEPAEVIDLANGEEVPAGINKALTDSSVLKVAYNAAFERRVLSEHVVPMKPEQWFCTMVQGLTLGMPAGLDRLGKVLNIADDKAKMKEGKKLIQYFCKPCRPTKVNGGRTRNLPEHNREGWETFKEYCRRDVEAERAIRKKLERWFPIPQERKLWFLDQKINDAGVEVDMQMVESALEIDARLREEWLEEAETLTGVDNPNSRAQILDWIESRLGWKPETFDKYARAELLQKDDIPKDVKRVITLKNWLGKTSIKKYQAMMNAVCSDGRVHGMLQFYGANRTGRWAGRVVQLHNLPQNHLEDLDGDRKLVTELQYDTLSMLYDNPADVLSQLIRTAFVAGEGKRFIVADFSAIEARVIAWLADEKWRMKVFADGGDIYCASASQMFKVPVEKHGVNGHLRQKGKIAELACIAEGQLVLTNRGLVPIEDVTTDMKVWDGVEWVAHEGVIYRGEKEVINYDGLTATADHLVYLRGESRPVRFGIAAASGSYIVQTGDGGREIQLGEDNQSGETAERKLESLLCTDTMHELRQCSMAGKIQSHKRKVKRLSEVLSAKAGADMAVQEADSCEIKMRECKRPGILPIWGKRAEIRVSKRSGGRVVPTESLSESRQEVGNRQNRYEQRLCSGQPQNGGESYKPSQSEENDSQQIQGAGLAVQLSRCPAYASQRIQQSTDYGIRKVGGTAETEKLARDSKKVRVYDIRNAGRNHRYTVSGKLVHNCGYGGGINALKAFGADKVMTEQEMQSTIKHWRESSPHICKLWRDVETCVKKAIRHKTKVVYKKNISFVYQSKMLFIYLPSGRPIVYVKPRINYEDDYDKESIVYEGVSDGGGMHDIYTWGGKLVENIVQAIARDCLAVSMLKLDSVGYKIVMHVHDEVILEMPYGKGSLQEACDIMAKPILWAPGLLLRGDGYETPYYKKD